MIDNNALVYSILKPVGVTFSCPVYAEYPAAITVFPCITFMDTDHSDGDFSDGRSHADLVEITVNCWEKADPITGITIEVHQAVDAAMSASGDWYDRGFVHLFEPDTKVHHYVQKYGKVEPQ